MCSGTLLWLVLVGALVALAVKLLRRRTKKQKDPQRSAIDEWVEESLAPELARRLKLESDAVLTTLRKEPDADTVSAIEAAVRKSQLAYSRLPQVEEIEVKLEVEFEDGTSWSAARRIPFTALPAAVAEEFTRTGGAYVYRPWEMPWAASHRYQ